MKLEVGMFVRFKDKRGIEYIRKITSVNTTYPDKLYAGIYIDKEANNSNGVSLKNIIKVSYNIIDILEVGDYVNGVEVININDEWITMSDMQVPILKSIANGMIETIVTKEQMEKMEYKVGE